MNVQLLIIKVLYKRTSINTFSNVLLAILTILYMGQVVVNKMVASLYGDSNILEKDTILHHNVIYILNIESITVRSYKKDKLCIPT